MDGKMDGKQFGQAMNTIAHSQAMLAAVRDYTKELENQQKTSTSSAVHEVDVDDLLDDPELERLHADRLAAMKQEAEKRAALERQGHGTYAEISEGEFLEVVTQSERVVCQFFHRDFERCKIMDRHLALLAKKYINTRFIKLSAPDSPFFTVKLQVKLLPCTVMFRSGVAVDRVVGFESLGGKDDFDTVVLERLLLKGGGVAPEKRDDDDSADEGDERAVNIRRGLDRARRQADSDEDSDFD